MWSAGRILLIPAALCGASRSNLASACWLASVLQALAASVFAFFAAGCVVLGSIHNCSSEKDYCPIPENERSHFEQLYPRKKGCRFAAAKQTNTNKYHQKKIKRARSDLRKELRKRPATNKPSNAKPLADWLQKHDFPSRNGKTEKERKLGKFVDNQKQAYVGNRKPYLTICDIRKLEALPGWTFPLPKFGEMLAILQGMNKDPGSLKNVTVQLCPPQSVRTVQLSITTHYDS